MGNVVFLFNQKKVGFTLIELSIVLVIIGLIVGGVLIGQDLIKSSEIRAQISQLKQYDTAVNTFRLKYNYLPGDMTPDMATQVGMVSRTGFFGHGNGDGLISSHDWHSPYFGETVLFWRDLSDANMINGGYNGDDRNVTAVDMNYIYSVVPKAKIQGNIVEVYNVGTYSNIYGKYYDHYYHLHGGSNLSGDALGYRINSDYAITPVQGFNIDTKIDDGKPQTGSVIVLRLDALGTTFNHMDSTGAGKCALTSTEYNLGKNYSQSMLCLLGIKMN